MDSQSNDTGLTRSRWLARLLAIGTALVAIPMRLIPHLWNCTPIGGLSLYCGSQLRSWEAFALPLVLLAVSNGILASIQGKQYLFSPVLLFVYASYLLYVLIGRTLCRTRSPWRIGAASVLGSLQFFLVTNFGSWLVFSVDPTSTLVLGELAYPRTLEGLAKCYLLGIPYFWHTLLGDALFTGALFGLHAVLSRAYFPTEPARAMVK
jgi:hypothetical protein